MIDLKSKSLMYFFAVAGLADAAISGRVMHMINRSPEFYVIYRLDKIEITGFLLIVCFGVPLVLASVAWLCAKHRVTAYLACLLYVALVAFTISGVLRDLPDPTGGWLIVSSAVVLAGASWLAFLYLEVVRVIVAATALGLLLTFYHAFMAADLAMPGLGHSALQPTSATVGAVDTAPRMPNIVFIVLDEFPVTTLLDRNGMIDAKRFPHLHALAADAYWFRQTNSVSCNTATAVPAILAGKLFGQPKPRSVAPILQNYPQNLFTLLGDTHEIEAWETLTRLCPAGACGDRNTRLTQFNFRRFAEHLGVAWLHGTSPVALASSLPDLDDFWMEAAADRDIPKENAHRMFFPVRVQQFRQLVESIVESDRPWLRFSHFLMPHAPFENLSDGTFYYKGATTYAITGKRWNEQSAHVAESYFRHILQAMFTDRLIGELVKRLHDVGEYETTTLVVVADHGVSFVPGDTRRVTNAQNFPNLIGVPFIMKLAGQHHGELIDTPVQTIDVLPTLMGSLDKHLQPTAFDGRDVLATSASSIKERLHYCSGAKYQPFQTELLSVFQAQVALRDAQFGNRPDGTLEQHFASFPDWLGRSVDEIGQVKNSGRTAVLRGLLAANAAVGGATNAPVYLNGTIKGSAPLGSDDLLFVATLNGQVAAVMPAVSHKQQKRIISTMLQPRLLRNGVNTLELYAVDRQVIGRHVFLKLGLSGVVADSVTDRFLFRR